MSGISRKRARQQSARRNTRRLLADIEVKLTEDATQQKDNDMDSSSEHSDEQSHVNSSSCTIPGISCDYVYETADERETEQSPGHEFDKCIWRAIDEAEGNLHSSSEEECDSNDEDEKARVFRNGLAEWATACNTPLTTVNKLLAFLREQNFDVPATATTLLHTPRQVQVSKISGTIHIYNS